MIKQICSSLRRSVCRLASPTLFCFAFACACPKLSWGQVAGGAVQLPQNPPNTQAQARFEDGVRHAQARRFDDAAEAFSQSFALGANRAALFAWAQSQRLAGRCEEAVPLYERFVAVSEQPEETQAAKIGLRRCEESQPRQEPVVQARTTPPTVVTSRPTGWALAVTSGGLALMTAGAIVALVSETERRAANRASTYDDHRSARARAETQRWAALAAGGAGVAALAVGLWLYARPNETTPSNNVSVAPLPNGSGLVMAWRGRF